MPSTNFTAYLNEFLINWIATKVLDSLYEYLRTNPQILYVQAPFIFFIGIIATFIFSSSVRGVINKLKFKLNEKEHLKRENCKLVRSKELKNKRISKYKKCLAEKDLQLDANKKEISKLNKDKIELNRKIASLESRYQSSFVPAGLYDAANTMYPTGVVPLSSMYGEVPNIWSAASLNALK